MWTSTDTLIKENHKGYLQAQRGEEYLNPWSFRQDRTYYDAFEQGYLSYEEECKDMLDYTPLEDTAQIPFPVDAGSLFQLENEPYMIIDFGHDDMDGNLYELVNLSTGKLVEYKEDGNHGYTGYDEGVLTLSQLVKVLVLYNYVPIKAKLVASEGGE